MNLEDFKKGIFQLPHKRFGTLCQIMINKLFSYSSPINNYHDLFDNNSSHRIEIKFSIVREKWKKLFKEDNVIECIENSFDGNKIMEALLQEERSQHAQQMQTSEAIETIEPVITETENNENPPANAKNKKATKAENNVETPA